MNVVDVSAVFVLVLLLDHVFFVELSQSLFEVGEDLIELTSNPEFFAVVFFNKNIKYLS